MDAAGRQEPAADIRDLRDTARKAEAAVRDIAELLDVSPQRVSQLANA